MRSVSGAKGWTGTFPRLDRCPRAVHQVMITAISSAMSTNIKMQMHHPLLVSTTRQLASCQTQTVAPPLSLRDLSRNSEVSIGMVRTFVAPDKVVHLALHLAETRVGVVHPSREVFQHPTSGERY